MVTYNQNVCAITRLSQYDGITWVTRMNPALDFLNSKRNNIGT